MGFKPVIDRRSGPPTDLWQVGALNGGCGYTVSDRRKPKAEGMVGSWGLWVAVRQGSARSVRGGGTEVGRWGRRFWAGRFWVWLRLLLVPGVAHCAVVYRRGWVV